MKTQRLFLAALATLVASHGTAMAVLTEADLTRTVAPQIEKGILQAVSLGVVQRDGSATAHAGTLSLENRTAPDDRTLYEIGSISKVLTGLLLAEAVVRGEVTLDTTIDKLLPADVALPDGAGAKITLRMLSTHTSGLPRVPAEIPADNFVNPYANYGVAELWLTLRNVKLDFEPGTKASYSNLAAGLLGTLLAQRAGMSYDELLTTRIAQPLGMKDTVVVLSDEQRARFAPAFISTGAPWTHWDFQALAPCGGIRSTLADMMRFAAAMLHPQGTSLEKAIELGWAKQELTGSVAPGGQGLGWMLAGDGQTRWHNGMTGGFHAAIFVSRQYGVATVLLSNRSTPVGSEIAESLMRRAAGIPERPAPNRDRVEVALTSEQLDRCVGTFRISPQFALVFERRNHELFLTPTGQATDRLYAASPDTFFSRRVAADIVFELPGNNAPAPALVLKQNGREVRAVRE